MVFKYLREKIQKRKFIRIFSYLFSLGLVVFLVIYLKQNENIFLNLKNISFWYFLLLFFLRVITLFALSIINHMIIRKIRKNVPFVDNITLQFANQLLNKIIPKGGAAFRGVYLKERYNFPYSKFISTISGIYIISFLSYSIVAFFVFITIFQATGKYNIFYILAFSCVFFLTTFLTLLPRNFFDNSKGRVCSILKSILEGWFYIKKDSFLIIIIIVITIFNLTINSIIIEIIYQSMGLNTSYMSYLFLSVISSLTIFVNLTPDAIGIKEGLYAFSTDIVGIAPEYLILGSLIDRAIDIFVSLSFGLISYFWLMKKSTKKIESY